jgi:hypothetical protein
MIFVVLGSHHHFTRSSLSFKLPFRERREGVEEKKRKNDVGDLKEKTMNPTVD